MIITSDIPLSVQRFARVKAIKFQLSNPKWKSHKGALIDEWDSCGNYDINIYSEDGYLSVSVYPHLANKNKDGYIEIDYSNFVTLIKKESKK